MSNELVSVILPIYNVELYLKECIESVIKQSYKNLEIILVDDGSTDQSPYICDEYAKIDSRIKVIHKQNGGLSDARNVGLGCAKGKYVSFIDSDDFIKIDFIEKLLEIAVRDGSQISCCKFRQFKDKGAIEVNENEKDEACVMPGKKFIEDIYKGQYSKVAFVAWNKLYSIKLFREHDIKYPKGRVHEDTFTTYKLFYYSKKISIVESEMYFYRLREGSIMNSKIGIKRCKDKVEANYSCVVFFDKKNEVELTKLALNAFCGTTIRNYKDILALPQDKETIECLNILMEAYRKAWVENRKFKSLGIIKCIIYSMFIFFPDFISRMIK